MKFRLGTRGTATAEFAVAISVVLMLMFAIFDIGLLFAAQHALNYAVEKAARYAAVNSSASVASIKSQVVTAITPAVGATQANNVNASVAFSPSEKVGGTVTVSATLAWSPVSPIDTLTALTLTSSQTLTIQH